MNMKYWVLVGILILSVVFLTFDKCGSSIKLDRLKGEYKEAKETAKVEKLIKEEIIKKQQEEIEVLNTTIEVKNTTIAKKERSITELDADVLSLERSFLEENDKDAKISNLIEQVSIWKEKFTLSQGIIADKDEIIFSLSQKYQAQLVISDSYKAMYDTLAVNTEKLRSVVRAQDWRIKKLTITSRVKTGIVLAITGVVIYSFLKD